MGHENLSPEQQERARACESTEELAAIAEEGGLELSDEMLEGIAGGGKCWLFHEPCPEDEHPHPRPRPRH